MHRSNSSVFRMCFGILEIRGVMLKFRTDESLVNRNPVFEFPTRY